MPQFDLKNATIKIFDGGSENVTLKIGQGNLSWTETRQLEYTPDRGVVASGFVRELDEVPMEVSFDVIFEYYSTKSGVATYTPVEIIKGTSSGTTTFTSDGAAGEPYACRIQVVNVTTTDTETFEFEQFTWENINFDMRAGTLSVTGKCKLKEIATHTRITTP
jgi:hypothetical protein